jgi:hypothetical protein
VNAGIRNVLERLIELTGRGPIGAKFTLKRKLLPVGKWCCSRPTLPAFGDHLVRRLEHAWADVISFAAACASF